jgi:hypothetical protein
MVMAVLKIGYTIILMEGKSHSPAPSCMVCGTSPPNPGGTSQVLRVSESIDRHDDSTAA